MLQVEPQLMPEGLLMTWPLPFFFTTMLPLPLLCGENVAVTDISSVMETVQFPFPLHAPLQPLKLEPAAAVAVKVTDVPLL